MILASSILSDPAVQDSVKTVVMGIIGLSVGGYYVVRLFDRFTKPTGAEAMQSASDRYQVKGDYITRGEFVQANAEKIERFTNIEEDLSAIRREMAKDKEAVIAAGEERAVKIHERINDVATQIGGDVKQLIAATAELRGEIRSHRA